MATKNVLLRSGATPGSNLGTAFTADIPETIFSPGNKFIDHFTLSYKGDLAACQTVAMETFLDVVLPFAFKKNGETRVQLRGRDIYALNAAFLRRFPGGWEGATATDDKIDGMHIPVYEEVDPQATYSYSVTRSAVTNVSGEVLTLGVETSGRVIRRPLMIVEITATTAGAAGIQTLIQQLPRRGRLLGMLCFITGTEDGDDDEGTWNHLFIDVDDQNHSSYGLSDPGLDVAGGIATNWPFDVLRNYRYVSFEKDPLDLVANKVSIRTDSRETSTAVRFIPIIEL